MRKLWSIAFFSLAACGVGDDPITGDEHPDDKKPPITGTITKDETITGMRSFTGQTVIAAGVTVTVDAGATLNFAQDATLTVEGALFINGTVTEKVVAKFADGATNWGPIDVYGTMRINYASFTGGAISTNGALSVLEITDSKLFKASGDYIVMNGGSINMSYSQLGPDEGETDSTHCNMHINTATTVSVIRSNINGAPFGLMFYGGVGANFQLNNWFGNPTKDVDTRQGVEGNFSGGWFERGAPVAGPGAMLTAENLAAAKLTQAGPRP